MIQPAISRTVADADVGADIDAMCMWPGNLGSAEAVDTAAIAERLKAEFGLERQALPEHMRALLDKLDRSFTS